MDFTPKFINDISSPPAKAIGKTLADLWKLSIGSHISLWVDKQGVKHQKDFSDYIKKIEEKTQAIPNENLVNPKLHIVGPAIEASKYYIESETLRDMFANLIAASIDSSKTSETHPAFTEIIKQLSPLDAKNLLTFKDEHHLPISEYRASTDDEFGNYSVLLTNVFLENKEIDDLYLISSSMANLSRLGIIEIDYETYIPIDGLYNIFEETKLFKEFERLVKNDSNQKYTRVIVTKGLARTTPLGSDFIKTCLN